MFVIVKSLFLNELSKLKKLDCFKGCNQSPWARLADIINVAMVPDWQLYHKYCHSTRLTETSVTMVRDSQIYIISIAKVTDTEIS